MAEKLSLWASLLPRLSLGRSLFGMTVPFGDGSALVALLQPAARPPPEISPGVWSPGTEPSALEAWQTWGPNSAAKVAACPQNSQRRRSPHAHTLPTATWSARHVAVARKNRPNQLEQARAGGQSFVGQVDKRLTVLATGPASACRQHIFDQGGLWAATAAVCW